MISQKLSLDGVVVHLNQVLFLGVWTFFVVTIMHYTMEVENKFIFYLHDYTIACVAAMCSARLNLDVNKIKSPWKKFLSRIKF